MLFLAPEEQVPVLYPVHPLQEQGHALLVVGDEAGGHVGLTVVGRRGLCAKINYNYLTKSAEKSILSAAEQCRFPAFKEML